MNKKAILFIAVSMLIAGNAYASTVTRSCTPATLQPGADLTVMLSVDITGNETFYVIDEIVPSGWAVKDAGTGSAEHSGHIKWVEIQGAKDTTVTYTLTASNQTGLATFAGTFMFERMETEAQIAGQSQVSVGESSAVGKETTDLVTPLIALVIIIAIVAIAVKRK